HRSCHRPRDAHVRVAHDVSAGTVYALAGAGRADCAGHFIFRRDSVVVVVGVVTFTRARGGDIHPDRIALLSAILSGRPVGDRGQAGCFVDADVVCSAADVLPGEAVGAFVIDRVVDDRGKRGDGRRLLPETAGDRH